MGVASVDIVDGPTLACHDLWVLISFLRSLVTKPDCGVPESPTPSPD